MVTASRDIATIGICGFITSSLVDYGGSRAEAKVSIWGTHFGTLAAALQYARVHSYAEPI